MSSHHIVRDEQEPALIIHRLHAFPSEVLGALLEWSPTLSCCEPAIEEAVALGIKVDVALVSFQQLAKTKDLLADQYPVKILSQSDSDFLSSGLQLLVSDHHSAVNILTSEEGVEEVVDLARRFVGKLQISVWTEENRHTFIRAKAFRKWFPAGVSISYYALEDGAVIEVQDAGGKEITSESFELHQEGIVKVFCDKPPYVLVQSVFT